MIKGGKGGDRTITGLRFETRISLKQVFESLTDYSFLDNVLYFKGEKVAEFYEKHNLYKKLLEPKNIDYKEFISKKLLPDDAILVLANKTLFIIEIKFQEVAGSVDEKLQTCDFKKREYKKLLAPLKIDVEYVYILNDWFKKPEYKDVLNYIEQVDCKYFFNELPLNFLGLPETG